MNPKPFVFGILCLALEFSPAQAEILSNLFNFFKGPAAVDSVAVPRPINQSADQAADEPMPKPEGEVMEHPLIEDGRPKASEEKPKTNYVPIPGWDDRRISILGIDRTEFPEILVLMAIRDREGYPALKVDPKGFKVTEDEAPQTVTSVAPCIPGTYPGEPISIALLIDSSGSMQKYLPQVQVSAARFVQRFREDDEGAVIAFCSSPIVLCPPTTNTLKLEKAISQIYPRGFTALYDSVHTAVQNLQNCGGRKAIVLLTDGKDDDGTGAQLSRRSLNSVIEASQRGNIPIYSIGLGSEVDQATLEKMAFETGGQFLFAPTGADLDELYLEIARSLGRGDIGYYKLTYRASEEEKDGTTRTLIIHYDGGTGVATYPSPKRMIWPLSKVF